MQTNNTILMSNFLERIELAENKVQGLVEKVKEIETIQKIKNDLRKKQVWHYRFYRVPSNYYDRTLEERAILLNGNVPQLCKSIIFENTFCDHQDTHDITNSKYYLVIVQYMSKLTNSLSHNLFVTNSSPAKINPTSLRNFVHSLKPAAERLSKSSFNFQLASEEISLKFSGFEHNAITPYGMNMDLPVIVDSRLLEVQPGLIFLGGGFVDMKLLVPLPDLIGSLHAKVGLITDPR